GSGIAVGISARPPDPLGTGVRPDKVSPEWSQTWFTVRVPVRRRSPSTRLPVASTVLRATRSTGDQDPAALFRRPARAPTWKRSHQNLPRQSRRGGWSPGEQATIRREVRGGARGNGALPPAYKYSHRDPGRTRLEQRRGVKGCRKHASPPRQQHRRN